MHFRQLLVQYGVSRTWVERGERMNYTDTIKELLPLDPLDYYILAALLHGDSHGYGLKKSVEVDMGKSITGSTFYRRLRIMEHSKVIQQIEDPSASNGPRRKNFISTLLGRVAFDFERERMKSLVNQRPGTSATIPGRIIHLLPLAPLPCSVINSITNTRCGRPATVAYAGEHDKGQWLVEPICENCADRMGRENQE